MICPQCGAQDAVEVTWGMVARPLGSFSLPGNQFKFSALEVAIATCSACGMRLIGHLETGSDPDDGLYFVTDPRLTAQETEQDPG